MKRAVELHLLCVFLFAMAPFARGAETRLALRASSSSPARFADLLAAELSKTAGITLLDRAELDRAISERNLSPAASAQILGADGLVMLDAEELPGAASLSLRVVSTGTGVALGWWSSSVPDDQLTRWAQSSVLQIKSILPRLSRSPQNLAPVSFVGFSSPASSGAARSLEREVNSVFLSALGTDPGLVVLERSKLAEAAFEKNLQADDREFWSGAFLLEGTLNPDQIAPGKLVISYRLLRADGHPVAEERFSGASTNLASIAMEFAQRVHKQVHAEGTVSAWDAAREAARFFDEAAAAVRLEMWPEAIRASETAFALGKSDLESWRVRLAASAGAIRRWQHPDVHPPFGVIGAYAPPPGAADLENALLLAGWVEQAVERPDLATPLKSELNAALEAIGWLAFDFYFGAELRSGHEKQLENLRAVMQRVCDTLVGSRAQAKNNEPLQKVLRRFGGLWQETPERGVEFHKKLRALNPLLYWEKLDPSEDSEWVPPLAGWTWTTRQTADELWKRFVSEPRPIHSVAQKRPQILPPRFPRKTLPRPIQAATAPLAPKLDVIPARCFPLGLTNKGTISVAAARTAGDQLWLMIHASGQEMFTTPEGALRSALASHYYFCGVDPNRGLFEKFELPGRYFNDFADRLSFAVLPDRFIFAINDRLVRCDRATRRCTDVPAPLKDSTLVQSGSRLFLWNDESILRASPELQDFKVLASVRRRPALTPMDELPKLTEVQLLDAGGAEPFVLAANTLFTNDGQQWRAILTTNTTLTSFQGDHEFLLACKSLQGFQNTNTVFHFQNATNNPVAVPLPRQIPRGAGTPCLLQGRLCTVQTPQSRGDLVLTVWPPQQSAASAVLVNASSRPFERDSQLFAGRSHCFFTQKPSLMPRIYQGEAGVWVLDIERVANHLRASAQQNAAKP